MYVDSNPWVSYFQANHMLELALHLAKLVINLKMDALWLWNIALAGTACGNLLNLTEKCLWL